MMHDSKNTKGLVPSIATLGLAVVLLTIPAGCSQTKVAQPLTKELSGSEPAQQMAFWHTLAERPLTSNDEAFHGLLLFLDGTVTATDYDSRVQLLRERNMLPNHFNQPADQAVQRGTLAVAMVRALQIRGGVMLTLLGSSSPRYAIRDLEYQNLLPSSSPHQTLSGTEFVGVIGRMEDYLRIHPVRANESTAGEIEQARKLGRSEAPTTAPAKP